MNRMKGREFLWATLQRTKWALRAHKIALWTVAGEESMGFKTRTKKRTGSSIYKKKASQCGRRKVYIFCTHCLFFLVVLKLQNVRVQKHIHMAFRFSSALARRAPIRCTLARCTEVPRGASCRVSRSSPERDTCVSTHEFFHRIRRRRVHDTDTLLGGSRWE